MVRNIVKFSSIGFFFTCFILMLLIDREVLTFMEKTPSLILFGFSFVVLIASSVFLVKTSQLRKHLDTLNENLNLKD